MEEDKKEKDEAEALFEGADAAIKAADEPKPDDAKKDETKKDGDDDDDDKKKKDKIIKDFEFDDKKVGKV